MVDWRRGHPIRVRGSMYSTEPWQHLPNPISADKANMSWASLISKQRASRYTLTLYRRDISNPGRHLRNQLIVMLLTSCHRPVLIPKNLCPTYDDHPRKQTIVGHNPSQIQPRASYPNTPIRNEIDRHTDLTSHSLQNTHLDMCVVFAYATSSV